MLPSYIDISYNAKQALTVFLDSKEYSRIIVLVDENTKEHCYPKVAQVLPSNHILIKIKSGEGEKTLETCTEIWKVLTENNVDRKALMINLGGGVIGDMGGFCACTYKRGIAFVNIPTTLLSQVDASIGGKLGVDFGVFKNHIGLFRIPDKVIIDPVFLETLSFEELRSGYAEVIKHSLIADEDLFEELSKLTIEQIDWPLQIAKSLGVKNNIVEQDPFENGKRKWLNFGHTIGHAIESYYLNTESMLRHGEAIAIGMICEAYVSHKKLKLTASSMNSIVGYLTKAFPFQSIPEKDFDSIMELMFQDKKNLGGKINAVLLNSISEPVHDIVITHEEVFNSLKYYNSLA